jgi:YD repeat-containing protein
MAQSYSVGQVARECDTTVRTLQFYDRLGLLVADRDHGGRRRYRYHHLERLRQIQLLSSAGFSLQEIPDILDRQAGRPLAEVYADQVRLLELAELRLRCRRTVLAAIAEIVAEHPNMQVPEAALTSVMSIDSTLLRYEEIFTGPESGLLQRFEAAPEVDLDATIAHYFDWKAQCVQALIMVENGIPADSPSGRRLGHRQHQSVRTRVQSLPDDVIDIYLQSERDHHRWPPADRELHRATKGFLDQCLRSYADSSAADDGASGSPPAQR